MKDTIKAWEVVIVCEGMYTVAICLSKDTADYVRDWCEADSINIHGHDSYEFKVYETEAFA